MDRAVRAFEAAVDADADGEDTHTSVVSFLITRGDYARALDTYHRALGNHAMSDYAKVYMSLWMMAEARRRGQAPDPLAHEFLRGREGTLWYDELARYATGRVGLSALESRASTRGRRAELWYYEAVLGDAGNERAVRALLERVVGTDMVLFFEYDMAKHWLSEGLGQGEARLSGATR
jgi:tetratricopeptide (TPR) repeat protein